MHVMTKTDAERHGLFTIDPVTGKQIPFSTIRFEMTEQEKKEHQRMLDEGIIQF